MRRMWCCAVLLVGLVAAPLSAADEKAAVSLESDLLRISLAHEDASLMVIDKRLDLAWRQEVMPGFRVVASSVKQTPGSISAEASGKGGPY
ncbi:MAG: hypothetical protein JF612_06820 [Planctomycetia bacterium]|nr:hypothetical protein [Planctomycetia bacterium]